LTFSDVCISFSISSLSISDPLQARPYHRCARTTYLRLYRFQSRGLPTQPISEKGNVPTFSPTGLDDRSPRAQSPLSRFEPPQGMRSYADHQHLRRKSIW
jgi:hypothetical protein